MKLNNLSADVRLVTEKKKDEGTPAKERPGVKAALERSPQNQEQIADKVDVHPSTISRIKKGSRNPSLRTLKALSKATRTSATNLLPDLKT